MTSRTVRFFEVLDEDGEQIPQLEWDGFLDAVRVLPEEDAYVHIARMELLGSIYRPRSGSTRACPMLVLDRITRDARIRIENRRKYRPLELRPGDTIAEPTHYGLFDQNVVGILRAGMHTPGPASLRDFINVGDFFERPVTVKALADSNAIRAFGEVGTLTKMEIELDAVAASETLGQSLFGEVARNFRTRLGGVSVDVIVKVDRYNGDASEAALDELRGVVLENRESITKAKMSYRRLEDGRADTFDFVNESVAKSIDVDIDEQGGGATDLSASQGIAKAYDALYDDIQSALAGRG